MIGKARGKILQFLTRFIEEFLLQVEVDLAQFFNGRILCNDGDGEGWHIRLDTEKRLFRLCRLSQFDLDNGLFGKRYDGRRRSHSPWRGGGAWRCQEISDPGPSRPVRLLCARLGRPEPEELGSC